LAVAPSFGELAPAANDAAAWAGLCARLSHELRTPLNAVLGFSELMKEELHGPLGRPRYREYVSHIRESGQALLKSTEDTLAITAVLSNTRDQNATTLRRLAVEPLLTDAWHFIEPSARARSVGLELDVRPGLEVLADQRALRQALINLLEEAVCHAADGDSIAVTAACERGMVEVEIKSGSCQTARLHDTLPVTLAKALLDFSGCKLQISIEGGRWHARTSLDGAAQPDFFEELVEARSATA
jgi:two-component system cell cycle sensor histidine kinase PleC